MSLTQILYRAFPLSYQIRVRYAYRYLVGTIDREVRFLRTLLDGRGRVIDVGANHGIFSYGLLSKAEAVESFEPNPELYHRLAAFGGRLHAHGVALSDHEGTAVLHVPYINGRRDTGLASLAPGNGVHDKIEVRLQRLDRYEFQDVVLIKIDVEGHEREVLRGAQDTIRRNRPLLCVEIEQRHLGHTPIQDEFARVEELGYNGFFLDQTNRVRPIREFRYEHHQAPYVPDLVSHDPQYGQHEYVNNFVFVHRDDARRARLQ